MVHLANLLQHMDMLPVVGTPPGTQLNTIDRFPFSSDTNASDVGDLTVAIITGVVLVNQQQLAGYVLVVVILSSATQVNVN
jgi:hypothetical protein